MFDLFFKNGVIKESCKNNKTKDTKSICERCHSNPCKCNKIIDESKKEGYCKLCKSSPCKCNLGSKVAGNIKSATDKVKKRLDVRKSLKEALVGEVLYHILDESLGIQLDNSVSYNVMKRNLVESFVSEKGAQTIMDKLQEITPALYEAQSLCEEYLDKMLGYVNEEEYFIDPDEKANFYKDLKSIDFSDITALIKTRVGSAIDDFTQSNATLKAEIEDVMNNSKQKADSASSEDMKSAYESFAIREQNRLRDSKVKNIFESMFLNISSAALLNENMNAYIKEDGKLDNYKILDNTKVMYSFLEMLNLTRLEKIDENYVKDVIKSLK